MKLRLPFLFITCTLFFMSYEVLSQDLSGELAATLEVLKPDVEVQRVNTVNWIVVKAEAIVGVGDIIRTNETGSARITFFADGTDTELLPNTEYRIVEFEGNEESFNLNVEIIVGQTTQRLGRLLDASSTYNVNTPAMTLAARGTQFAIRVENGGRSGMLVSEGTVDASNAETRADVMPGFGVRSTPDDELSDVVRASTFEQLDAAIDGCSAEITTQDDVRLNVRIGPGIDFPRVATIGPDEVQTLFGQSEDSDWYRIEFRGGYGWILASHVKVGEGCAGLRLFSADYGPEDISKYTSLGEEISRDALESSVTPTITPSES